jgi:hypothetical protein
LWGHLKEHVYAASPRIIEDLVTILQAAMTTIAANMLRRVQENAMWHIAVCLEMDGGHFKYQF